jgi:hypothetical protein
MVQAVLREYFPVEPVMPIERVASTRARSYERLLENYASRSYRTGFSRESNMPRFQRVPASFLREYRRSCADFSFRGSMANQDQNHKPSAARAVFPRRRATLGALTRRPRVLSAALSYS